MKFYFTIFSILIFFGTVYSQNISQWRGKARSGVYNETALLKQWPENGPELLWYNDSLLEGYSSLAINNNTFFITGIKDSLDILIALNNKGKELWRKEFGKAWDGSYPESRCTPTIENNRIYVLSGKGEIACLNALNGEIFWSIKVINLFEGKCGRWGYSESLLLDENNVYVTTGGDKTTMVALNKQTGKLAWQSESLSDNVSYTSPIMIEKGDKKIIVNVTDKFIFAVQPVDGKMIWKFDISQYKKDRSNKANTPLYSDGGLYFTSGYDHKGLKFNLNNDLSNIELNWTDTVLDNHMGGVVKIGNYIYGSNWLNNGMGNWVCLDWNTGKKQYETKWENKGPIVAADGMLYIMDEKSGNIALLKADPQEFKVMSSFKIPKGKGPYWAHPVIDNGVLYIRHGAAVMAYKIK
jgi:outer membrane protein assembly factor BamB